MLPGPGDFSLPRFVLLDCPHCGQTYNLDMERPHACPACNKRHDDPVSITIEEE